MTNKKTLIFLCFSLFLCVANACLLYKNFKLKGIVTNEVTLRQNAEWTIIFGIGNVGQSVSLDSVTMNCHLFLRYDETTCLTCIAKAEKLLDEVFGKEYLLKELCCVGQDGQVEPTKGIRFIKYDKQFTEADNIYTPYLCIVNDNGEILYTLSLIPDMYDYNREILKRLRKVLNGK